MSTGITNPSEAHLGISDQWLTDNSDEQNAVIYCNFRDGKDPKHDPTALNKTGYAKAISITGDLTTRGEPGIVRGYQWDETPVDVDDYDLSARTMYPIRFKRIYAYGTTARGIKIYY